jgi:ribose 5-phosphate isomerase B
MKIAIACDHAGFPLKKAVIDAIRLAGFDPLDLGTNNTDPVDYPDYAVKIGQAIQSGEAARGVFLCGSGVGASIAANKIRGIYAGVCHDTFSAHQGVEHDDMNVLCLGARIIGINLAQELVAAFLGAKYQVQEERHVRRVEKVKKMEIKPN